MGELVIPGRANGSRECASDDGASPESITTESMDSGPAPNGASRNDGSHPIRQPLSAAKLW
jgi:hypothetical protein